MDGPGKSTSSEIQRTKGSQSGKRSGKTSHAIFARNVYLSTIIPTFNRNKRGDSKIIEKESASPTVRTVSPGMSYKWSFNRPPPKEVTPEKKKNERNRFSEGDKWN